ncbi:hypothetical protein FSP39_009021 [Pinctada imbricata]|uniref:AB hydrolase-1 domain-containing protein n=1 Tax=Pinctada imbricata TaxID=66713 RepID=A0AA88YQH6_PINIB|nr:hypothetical protein FSP39_009021 [Pinctada imbricata]
MDDLKVKVWKVKAENVEPFSKRFIFVHTLTDVYVDVKYGGIYDVCYLDSDPTADFKVTCPTVLAFHESPGTHRDFLKVLTPLAKMGYRVIVPNFPGYGETEGMRATMDNLYTGDIHEKLAFIKDFINVLEIPRVDLLVGFGEGCYPAMHCSLTNPKVFRSLAMICPCGHKEYRGVRPLSWMGLTDRLWKYYSLRPILFGFWQARKSKIGWKNRKAYHVIQAVIELSRLEFQNVSGCLLRLKKSSVPFCVVCTEKDDRTEKEISEEMISLLGLTPQTSLSVDMEIITNNTDIQQDYTSQAFLLENAGHNIMDDPMYSNKVSMLLIELLKYSRSRTLPKE